MKVFLALPEKFSRKGITYVRSKVRSEEAAKATGRRYRTVTVLSKYPTVWYYLEEVEPIKTRK